MKTCKGCGELTVDPEEPPRYDVFNPEYIPGEDMSTIGPYCAPCFRLTVTGAVMEGSETEPEEP